MVEVRSYDVPTQDLIDTTRDQIANLLFRNPNEPFIVHETQTVGYTQGGKVVEERQREVEVGRLSPREAHKVQAHGLFQLWSRMVELAGVEQANFWTFGIPESGVIFNE